MAPMMTQGAAPAPDSIAWQKPMGFGGEESDATVDAPVHASTLAAANFEPSDDVRYLHGF